LSEPPTDKIRTLKSTESQHSRYFEEDFSVRTIYVGGAANRRKTLFSRSALYWIEHIWL